jgi:hypothetical protein
VFPLEDSGVNALAVAALAQFDAGTGMPHRWLSPFVFTRTYRGKCQHCTAIRAPASQQIFQTFVESTEAAKFK